MSELAAKLKHLMEWQPIETAPRTGKPFLAVYGGQVRVVQWGKTSHVPIYGFCLADQGVEDFDICDPTHWMPMPPLPDLGVQSSTRETQK